MFCNIAAYKFITIDEEQLNLICRHLKDTGLNYGLKGTILLSREGINLFLAGEKQSIVSFQDELTLYSDFSDLHYKYSYSLAIPFKKLCVKIKPEIVTFKQKHIQPETYTAPYILPQKLKAWFENNQEMTLLDTRNTFEYQIGTFKSAIHLAIDNFRDFPVALKKHPKIDKNKPIVTFCTGGIRCEKAATYLLDQGFKEVYQLQGGILNYFEQCGGDFYEGNCFVFDDRVMLNSKLEPQTRDKVAPDPQA